MAAGILPKPGTKVGPCKAQCKHIDCAETRTMAKVLCSLCHERIGYDRLFYREGTIHQLVHEGCAQRYADHAQTGA